MNRPSTLTEELSSLQHRDKYYPHEQRQLDDQQATSRSAHSVATACTDYKVSVEKAVHLYGQFKFKPALNLARVSGSTCGTFCSTCAIVTDRPHGMGVDSSVLIILVSSIWRSPPVDDPHFCGVLVALLAGRTLSS